MKIIKKCAVTLLATLLIMQTSITALTSVEEEYLRKYPAPNHIKEVVDRVTNYGEKNINQISHQVIEQDVKKTVRKIPNVPDFFLKPEISRFLGAEIIRKVSAKYKYDLAFVPDKYAYDNNDKVWVLSVNVSNICNKPFNRAQIEQLCGIVKKTYYCDLHNENVKPTDDGRFVILDTARNGFADLKERRIGGLYAIKKHLNMGPEALKYLEEEIKNEQIRNQIDIWFALEMKKQEGRIVFEDIQTEKSPFKNFKSK